MHKNGVYFLRKNHFLHKKYSFCQITAKSRTESFLPSVRKKYTNIYLMYFFRLRLMPSASAILHRSGTMYGMTHQPSAADTEIGPLARV